MAVNRTRCRVIYGDTDNMGFAYHANYFRWFEIGRTEMFRALGLPYRSIEAQGIFLPVSEAHCKYRRPIRYDALLTVETRLDPGLRAGVKFEYRLLDENGGEVFATGYTKHACLDREGRVVRPPPFLVEALGRGAAEA